MEIPCPSRGGRQEAWLGCFPFAFSGWETWCRRSWGLSRKENSPPRRKDADCSCSTGLDQASEALSSHERAVWFGFCSPETSLAADLGSFKCQDSGMEGTRGRSACWAASCPRGSSDLKMGFLRVQAALLLQASQFLPSGNDN